MATVEDTTRHFCEGNARRVGGFGQLQCKASNDRKKATITATARATRSVGLLRVRIRGRDSEYGAPSLRIRERERELALRVNNGLHGAYEMSLLRAPRVPSAS